jgi:hypothetical protein
MVRFTLLVAILLAAPSAAQERPSDRHRLVALEVDRQQERLEDIREDRRLVEERIEAAVLARELTPTYFQLPPAKVRVRTSPVPGEVFLIPRAILDLRPAVRDSLKTRGAYHVGFAVDSTGLEATAKETSYRVIVRACGMTEERDVSLFADRVVEVSIGVPCRP